MSTLGDFQKFIVDHLNRVDNLTLGGAFALAENEGDAEALVIRTIKEKSGVAILVGTPGAARGGANTEDKEIPLALDRVEIVCVEIPALNRAVAGHITAQDAAQEVILELDCPEIMYISGPDQHYDRAQKIITQTVVFKTTIILKKQIK